MGRRALAAALLALLALAGSSCGDDDDSGDGGSSGGESSEETYKVGAVLALTGDYSGTDKDSAAGLKATVAEINANGGVNGRKLEYKINDNQSDPAKSSLAAQQIVDEYEPDVMIPDVPCILALSALPVASRSDIVTFTGCDNGEPSDPSEYPYNFSTFPPAAVLGPPLVQGAAHVMDNEKLKIGLLYSNDAAGEALVPQVEAAAKDHGDSVVAKEAFAVGTPDLTVQMSKLRQAGANVVVLWGQVGDAGNAMKSVRDLDWDVQVFGGTGTTSSSLVEEIPENLQDRFHALVPALAVREGGEDSLPPFVTEYLQPEADQEVQTLSVVGAIHDGLTLWKWAVDRVKDTNPDAVSSEIEKLGSLPEEEWPEGLFLTANPAYAPDQHGELNADLDNAWGVVNVSENISGTYEGEKFECDCAAPEPES
jgi:branched-chain amino acid transport system substrate-binding protein